MGESKKPNWPFWAIVGLILLPVLYVTSFGPACWVSSRYESQLTLIVYRPLIHVGTRKLGQPKLSRTPPVQRFLRWYAELGADKFAAFSGDRIHWAIVTVR